MELLVTILVLVISTFILVPYASSGASSSGQSVARMAMTEMLAAQMDAVANQSYRRIHFFSDGSGWSVEELNSSELGDAYDFASANFVEDAVESQGQLQQSIIKFTEDNRFRDVIISNVLFDGMHSNFIFEPTGGIIDSSGYPSTGGSFVVNSGPHQWTVSVAPLTGKITVEKTGGTQ
tara:strand:- start:131 stop:664 length:534 start_codon:yes stop_codon:yes gene_type:complete